MYLANNVVCAPASHITLNINEWRPCCLQRLGSNPWMLKLRKILSHSPLLAQCQAVSGPCPWRSLLTLSTARSSPAKNPSKMFKQPTGTLSGGSVFARPRANMQGIQTGQPQSADYLFIVNHMLSSFAGCSSHTVQYVRKSDQIGHYTTNFSSGSSRRLLCLD